MIMSLFFKFMGNIFANTMFVGFIAMLFAWRKDKIKRDQYLLVTLVCFVLSFLFSGGSDWLFSLSVSLFIVSIIGVFYYWKKDKNKRYYLLAATLCFFWIGIFAIPESDDPSVRLSSSEITELVKGNKDESDKIADSLEEKRILAEKEKVEAEKIEKQEKIEAEKVAKEKEDEEKRLAEEKAEKDRLESAMSKMVDVNYIKMYKDYSDGEYKGKFIRTAGRADIVTNSLTITDGLDGYVKQISFNFDDVSQLDSVSEGDYVIISGQVDYKMMGVLSIEHSNIESIGGDAESLAKSYGSGYESEVANAEKASMSEFKNKAKSVNYDDVVRNPHNYKNSPVKVTLDVRQVMENSIIFDSGYVGIEPGTDNEWFASYKLSDGESRILEDDTITFYGEFDDVRKMKSVFMKVERYVPRLKVLYYE